MSTLDVSTFLASIHPFDELSSYELSTLVNETTILYFPQKTTILSPSTPTDYFYLIAKGVVEVGDDTSEKSYLLAQDGFESERIFTQTTSKTYNAFEETICYTVPLTLMKDLTTTNHSFGAFFHTSVVDKLTAKNTQRASSQVAMKLSELSLSPILIVEGTTSLFDAITQQDVTKASAILVNHEGKLGIITDTDIRRRVILSNTPASTPTHLIATWKIVTINHNDFLFNAILLMTRHHIKRLIVLDDNNAPVGFLTETDILAAYANQTQFAAIKISRAKTVEDLASIATTLPLIITSLHKEGTKTKHVMKVVYELHAKLFEKLFSLLVPTQYHNDCCLIIMGSEGRKEQILRTDQDNALIIRDGVEIPHIDQAMESFTQTLLSWGYPLCDGGVMASTKEWCKHLKEFKQEINDAVLTPTPEKLMKLAILADLNAVAGELSLGSELHAFTLEKMRNNTTLIAHFAHPMNSFGSVLGLFHSFILEGGSHKGEFDLKKGAIFPVIHGVRSLAIEKGVLSTNTFERIKELSDKSIISPTKATEMIEALEFLLTLRLQERLRKLELGKQPDNYIRPGNLSHFERDLLKESLKVVEGFKKFCQAHFKFDYIA